MPPPERTSTWLSRLLDRFAQRDSAPADGKGEARVKSRPIMDRALKEIFVPDLRARGFTGSFPHFRRIRSDRVDLLSFQYLRRGGQFVVELSQCGPAGIAIESEKKIPPDKVTVHDIAAGDRVHLSAGWGWRGKVFVFDRPSYDPPLAATEVATEANCAKAARAALEAFAKQAEQWWEQKAARR